MDININLELLYFINQKLIYSSDSFVNLCMVVNNVDLSNSDLSSANLLDEVKNSVNFICSSYSSISDRVLEIKNLFEKNDSAASLLFNYLDCMLDEFFDKDEDSFSYIFDINKLLEIYRSGTLDKLGDESAPYYMFFYQHFLEIKDDGEVVFNGEKYVNGLLEYVAKNYYGREAAVNSVLLILQLAADKGVKYDYQHKGTYESQPEVSLNDVISGVDCNAFVSWAIAQGTGDLFHWRSVEAFNNDNPNEWGGFVSGPKIDYSCAQPGDIFVNNLSSNGGGAHIGFIVANYPDREVFIVAEARSDDLGIVLNERTYKELRDLGYNVRDMEQFYD